MEQVADRGRDENEIPRWGISSDSLVRPSARPSINLLFVRHQTRSLTGCITNSRFMIHISFLLKCDFFIMMKKGKNLTDFALIVV